MIRHLLAAIAVLAISAGKRFPKLGNRDPQSSLA